MKTLYAIAQLRVVGCLVVFKEFYFHWSVVLEFEGGLIFSSRRLAMAPSLLTIRLEWQNRTPSFAVVTRAGALHSQGGGPE